MKKTLTYLIASLFIIGSGYLGLCEGQKFGGTNGTSLSVDMPYKYENPNDNCNSKNLGDCVSIKENDGTIIINLLKVFGLDADTSRDHKFIDYARAIINMALGLVAFIALLMSIYTFYMMFFSENEAGIKKAKGSLVGIFIALAIIGLAWIIVSFIFWRYQSNWKENEKSLQSNNISMGNNYATNIYFNV